MTQAGALSTCPQVSSLHPWQLFTSDSNLQSIHYRAGYVQAIPSECAQTNEHKVLYRALFGCAAHAIPPCTVIFLWYDETGTVACRYKSFIF